MVICRKNVMVLDKTLFVNVNLKIDNHKYNLDRDTNSNNEDY